MRAGNLSHSHFNPGLKLALRILKATKSTKTKKKIRNLVETGLKRVSMYRSVLIIHFPPKVKQS